MKKFLAVIGVILLLCSVVWLGWITVSFITGFFA